MEKEDKEKVDIDQLCKRLIKLFFKEFLDFFFPELYRKINFTKEPGFVDKELYSGQIEGKKSISDILAKVELVNGKEEIVYTHIEIQSTRGSRFSERMFNYFVDIRREYGKNIFACVIFLDKKISKKPVKNVFKLEFMGTKLLYEFNVRKTTNYNYRDYLAHENPITVALMSRMYFGNDSKALVKAEALKKMEKYKLTELQRETLLHFIDRLLYLNKKEKEEFRELVSKDEKYEEVFEMLTTWEEEALKKGIKKGRQLGKQEGRQLGKQEGRQLGKQEGIQEVAKKLLEKGFSAKEVSELSGLSIVEIEKLII